MSVTYISRHKKLESERAHWQKRNGFSLILCTNGEQNDGNKTGQYIQVQLLRQEISCANVCYLAETLICAL